MNRVFVAGVLLGLVSCSPGSLRITATAPPPVQCDTFFCGEIIAVTTSLSRSDELTEAECRALCGGRWCEGARPIVGEPGCSLLSRTELYCAATVFDCGYTFPTFCGPSNCSGCCVADGTCRLDLGSCGGESCDSCSTRRCGAANCAQLSSCGGQLEAAPRVAACADADGGVSSSWGSTAACVDACAASDAGELLECAGSLGSSCDDAGVMFASQCAADAGAPSACLAACRADREACDQACPKSSFHGCIACAASCGLTFASCAAACAP